ncbi:DUF4416 family protein [candidate division GN15 bacterium]|nr:DUF4416 family protein [candidate division GN15 bacterium]
MAKMQSPERAKLFVSAIYSSIDALADVLTRLEKSFGRIESETVDIPFSSDFYLEEMGENLKRRFYSFVKPVSRDKLPELKQVCTKIEKQFSDIVDDTAFRTVNLDPGLITADNVVMCSYREYNHRIYLGSGVFAEQTLIWSRNQFVRLPWTNLDFCDVEALSFFDQVRRELIDETAKTILPTGK